MITVLSSMPKNPVVTDLWPTNGFLFSETTRKALDNKCIGTKYEFNRPDGPPVEKKDEEGNISTDQPFVRAMAEAAVVAVLLKPEADGSFRVDRGLDWMKARLDALSEKNYLAAAMTPLSSAERYVFIEKECFPPNVRGPLGLAPEDKQMYYNEAGQYLEANEVFVQADPFAWPKVAKAHMMLLSIVHFFDVAAATAFIGGGVIFDLNSDTQPTIL